ncbi:MAG: 4-hydroxybenzoate octaprenyltransferase [Burkholderiales bacterium]|nr:4-hydroxybenzoate octaprenyltransferase [Burkholderiales bacterium]GIK87442.1 MAG: 4-hydroxybenzoate octaprenyltransferase [Betaproteobacteria bacterium]
MDGAGPAPRTRWRKLAARLDAYERLLRLDKPIGTLLLLWPTLSALWLATGGRPSPLLLVVFVVGTLLMRSAGCAVNDWADRTFDAHVERTARRPLAVGEIAPWEALALAAALAFCAFLLILATNRVAVLWSFPAAAIAFVYPFFKRFFALPQAFLGIAFSFGIPMAYAAAQGAVPPFAWALLVINLFWVVAYDTEYAMVDRDDDLRIGIRTSAITFGRHDLAAIGACYALHVAGLAWAGVHLGMGPLYHAGVAAAAGLAAYHLWLIRRRDRAACFAAFLHNHWLGLAVFAGVALDFAVRLRAWPTL